MCIQINEADKGRDITYISGGRKIVYKRENKCQEMVPKRQNE